MTGLWGWIAFNAVIIVLMALDLGLFHQRAHTISLREAATRSAIWIALSLCFGVGVWQVMGKGPGLEFFTGYLIEYALSVDNILVFVLIFSSFRVPQQYQHRVLFWGIIGALILRGAMIAGGAALVARFEWVLYVFGAFLVVTAIRMFVNDEKDDYDPSKNRTIKLVRRLMPVTSDYHGQSFFVLAEGKGGRVQRMATPLFVVLVLVDVTDVIFATDSIPAIFAVTRDPFIVYTSNVCAVLGLRALYFLVAGVVERFRFLKASLSLVLGFIGLKMLVAHWISIPTGLSLIIVAGILFGSILLSLWVARNGPPPAGAGGSGNE